MDECKFLNGKRCKILKKASCDNCKFRKTEKQYLEDAERSKLILVAKGLKPYLHWIDSTQYLGVKKK